MFNKPIVERQEGFTQVCVWPGTIVGPDKVNDFVEFMKKEFGVRVQYLEEIKTLPSRTSSGEIVPGTGNRNDLLFAVHNDDVGDFSIPRLMAGIRWIEDALSRLNNTYMLYDPRISRYKSWDAEDSAKQILEARVAHAGVMASEQVESEGGLTD